MATLFLVWRTIALPKVVNATFSLTELCVWSPGRKCSKGRPKTGNQSKDGAALWTQNSFVKCLLRIKYLIPYKTLLQAFKFHQSIYFSICHSSLLPNTVIFWASKLDSSGVRNVLLDSQVCSKHLWKGGGGSVHFSICYTVRKISHKDSSPPLAPLEILVPESSAVNHSP